MANIKSAKKRAIQSEAHRQHNGSLKSSCSTHVKKVTNAIAANNKDEAAAAYKVAVSVLDKMVAKKIMHKNAAARHKSRLNSQIKNLK